ncbi:hypothetical protein ACCO45_012620 [Purpureocillium lilacinum]|uniref:Uncharacterized protein n=1 Tax=Purpureocillium lilacinum TaxID=33203 RepID=A0ACC4D975_PURLI
MRWRLTRGPRISATAPETGVMLGGTDACVEKRRECPTKPCPGPPTNKAVLPTPRGRQAGRTTSEQKGTPVSMRRSSSSGGVMDDVRNMAPSKYEEGCHVLDKDVEQPPRCSISSLHSLATLQEKEPLSNNPQP